MSEINSLEQFIIVLTLSLGRITGVTLIAPFFSQQFFLGMARIVVSINLIVIVMPMVIYGYTPGELTYAQIGLLMVKEVILGVIMGFVVSLAFWAAEGAGNFLDTQRGASISQIFDPMVGGTTTPLGSLFNKFFIFLFFTLGGFVLFLTFFYKSFQVWPLFSFYPNISLAVATAFLNSMDYLMQTLVLIAAPIAIVLFLVEFGLGLMNRFAQQLNVFSLSIDRKSVV